MKELAYRPRCSVCGHAVSWFGEEEIFGRVRFVARCHGQTEMVELEPVEAKGLIFGNAFAAGAKRLGSGS